MENSKIITACSGVIASLLISGCASMGSSTKRTIGSLAGSSVGAAAGQAINATGVLGYAASMATSVLGNMAGTKVMSFFGGKGQKMQQAALIQALDASASGTAITWGEEGKPILGYAASTGAAFSAATGGVCRPFRLVTAKQKGMIDNRLVDAAQNARGAVNNAQSAADNIGNASNLGDAASGISDAAKAASGAAEAVNALQTQPGAPVDPKVAAMPVAQEMFGTACKNKKGAWAIIKA